jgi:16S rRNA (cytosine967-C5)-methyltransferase
VLLQQGAWLANGEQSRLVALDLHAFKTQVLLQRIARYGLKGVQPVTGDARELGQLIDSHKLPPTYGGALIDAPCSGSGTLRRHPEIRWNLSETEIAAMAQAGLEMLCAVASHIEPGGFLTYSTCSVLRQENEELIEAFLSTEAGAAFSSDGPYLRSDLRPGGPDAHFAARLVRNN